MRPNDCDAQRVSALIERMTYRCYVKRLVDVIVTLMVLFSALPFFIVLTALVRLQSKGPALYKQTRIGLNGVPFTIYKFRSMYQDADARLAEMVATSDRDGPCFKMRNDPRITPVGRLLRRTSLDELPQLFNILRGDMSLVGPRPALPVEVAQYSDCAMKRLLVRPGLTGLWQVSGRANLSFDEMIALDLQYIRDLSPALDAKILLRTLPAVTIGEGAY
ncbi:sugar transferase [Sagittula sp. SSi028]|uniref:sugar transferase n=1 Tax=Sagittula sp. SSi028 TaxID=3400636 RepID=UPI003AF60A07